MEDLDISEPPPPSPERVARRAIVLAAMSCRGITDGQSGNNDAISLAKRSYDWLQSLELSDEMSDWERRVLEAPLGTLSDRDRINSSWLSEAMVVLAWSLGKIDLPGLAEQCDPAMTANGLGFLQNREFTVLASPQLRPSEQLNEYNEFVYNVHWRLRNFSLNKNDYDFESLARKAWGEPILKFGLEIKDKDLCIGGHPISRAEPSATRSVTSITQERHRASNWLIGYASEDFYEVTTDT